MSPQEQKKNLAIDEQYKLYLEQKALRLAEEKAQIELKAEVAAAWAQKKKGTVVTTRKDHMCDGCGKLIPSGTKCKAPSELVNVSSRGYTMQILTRHYCLNCRPISEA
jgi:hypothetical protein